MATKVLMLPLVLVVLAIVLPTHATEVLQPGALIGGVFRVERLIHDGSATHEVAAPARAGLGFRFLQRMRDQAKLTPERIDKMFKSTGHAGSGSSGKTYLATVEELPGPNELLHKNPALTIKKGDKVAIKTPVSAFRDEKEDYISKECQLEQKIDNEHVVKCYGILVVDNKDGSKSHYTVMNQAGEQTLGSYIRKKIAANEIIPVSDIVSITSQILDGVAAINAKDIQHYDIKPDNIMITTSTSPMKIVIIDLGNARAKPKSALYDLCVNNDGHGATPFYRDGVGEVSHVKDNAFYDSFDIAAVGMVMADMMCGVDHALYTIVTGPDADGGNEVFAFGFKLKTIAEQSETERKDAFCERFNYKQCKLFRARECKASADGYTVPPVPGHPSLDTDKVGKYLYNQMVKAFGPLSGRFSSAANFKHAIDNTFTAASSVEPMCECAKEAVDHPRVAEDAKRKAELDKRPTALPNPSTPSTHSDSEQAARLVTGLDTTLELLTKHVTGHPTAASHTQTKTTEVALLLEAALKKLDHINQYIKEHLA